MTQGLVKNMWTAAGAGALRANTHRCIQSMGSNRCITCVNVLHNKTEGPKSSLQIKVYFGFYLKIKVGEAVRGSVWHFHSLWWSEGLCHLLMLVLCILSSPKMSNRKFYSTVYFFPLLGMLWRCWCTFPGGGGTCSQRQKYQHLL